MVCGLVFTINHSGVWGGHANSLTIEGISAQLALFPQPATGGIWPVLGGEWEGGYAFTVRFTLGILYVIKYCT